MKKHCWLLFGAMLSTSLLAQQVTNAPPSGPLGATTPAAATNSVASPASASAKAPAKKAARKSLAAATRKKDAGAELKTVPLVPGPAIVDADHVNVRGQAKLKSEVVTRLNKGQTVIVLEEIVRNNSASDEPSAWARIMLPTNTHVWVNSSFIDPTNKTVLPRRLNLRSGPGENFSVVGRLERGAAVVDAGGLKGSWLEIEAPTNSYAFVAAQFLKQEAPGAAPATVAAAATTTNAAPPETPATPAAVTDAPPVAAAPTEPPPAGTPAVTAPPTNAAPDLAATTNAAPVADEPPPKRIVQRQGVVRGTTSIQAPTAFAIYSVENNRIIDYLYTASPNLDLRRYKGLQIIVTGEEGIEERWGNTPVITIQKIQVVE